MRKGNQSSRACSVCRQKRTKCSGTKPCDRCVAHHEECNFNKQTQESKASLRTQIKELKKVKHDSQLIFDVLRGGKGSHAILNALQQNVSLEDIASALSDPNGAWALTDVVSRSESSASSFLQQPGQEASELDNVVTSSTNFNVSPVSSTAMASLPWMMSQSSVLNTTGLPPMGHTRDMINQVAPSYGPFYDGRIPLEQVQYDGASEGLRHGPHAQRTSPFGSGSLACGDLMDAQKG